MKTAFLPSAGLGKRLRPITGLIPKPLLPVCGEPIIHHVMRHCAEAGIERFIINVHHLPEAFEMAFPNHEWRGLPLELVHEPIRLETGGGLKNIEPLLDPSEPLLIYNSDILTDLPLHALMEHHQNHDALVTLASSPLGPDLHLVTDGGHRLRKVDRSGEGSAENRQHFLGISVVEPAFLRYLRKDEPESVVHGWGRALENDPDTVHVCEIDEGRWTDIGTLGIYEQTKSAGLDHRTLSLRPPRNPESPSE